MGTRPQRTCRAVVLLLTVALLALVLYFSIDGVPLPLHLACSEEAESSTLLADELHRSQFPESFVFGTATSAYQVEGATHEGGRGPCIWDNFTHIPGKIKDGHSPNVAADQYHRYEEDVDLIKSLNMDVYRFSIAWTRIFPDGRGPKVNDEGVAYYNRLIDALLRKGIEPYVTIHHWDLPQHLQDTIGGWLSPEIVGVYTDYAEACFAAFGDRVKHWITLNEPGEVAYQGFGSGYSAPGRTSNRTISPFGNSSTETYLVAHHELLAHAAAVDVYRRKFQATQGGVIGLTIDGEWAEPFTDAAEDVEAVERRILFQIGWFMDPIIFGDYPAVMRKVAGARLPTFSEDEVARLRNSLDFVGLNHYTTKWIKNNPNPYHDDFFADQDLIRTDTRDGVEIGPEAFSPWLRIVPRGIQEALLWVYNRYHVPMYVTENGMDDENKQSFGQPLPADALEDALRVVFFSQYISEVLGAIRKGVDLRGYFVWSLLDNFEWSFGYTSRFGLFYVDYATLKRYPKSSTKWFTKLLEKRDGNHCQKRRLGFRFLKKLRSIY